MAISIWDTSPRSIIRRFRLRKGLTPVALGPNALGGSINLVSFQPDHKINVQDCNRLAAATRYEYGVNASEANGRNYCTQAVITSVIPTILPLSHDYKPTTYQPDRRGDKFLLRFSESKHENGIYDCSGQEFTFNYQYQNNAKRESAVHRKRTRSQICPILAMACRERQSLYFISKNRINARTTTSRPVFMRTNFTT